MANIMLRAHIKKFRIMEGVFGQLMLQNIYGGVGRNY